MKKVFLIIIFALTIIVACSCSEEAVADEQGGTEKIESSQANETGDTQNDIDDSESEDLQGNQNASVIESSSMVEYVESFPIVSNAIGIDKTEDTQVEPDGEAPDGGKDSTECTCNCHCSQYSISMGEAILIAQNHYFATIKIDDYFNVYHVITPICISDSEECWRIKITERCVGRCDEIHLIKGYSHLYVIDKKTGEIIDINPQY